MEHNFETWRIFFESLPIILAFFTLVLSIRKALDTFNSHVKCVSFMYSISAVLLIIAQSSWSWTLLIQKDLNGTDFANLVWTAFNTVTMASMAYAIQWADKK